MLRARCLWRAVMTLRARRLAAAANQAHIPTDTKNACMHAPTQISYIATGATQTAISIIISDFLFVQENQTIQTIRMERRHLTHTVVYLESKWR